MLAHIISRRALAAVAVTVTAAVGSVAGISVAQGTGSPATVTTSTPSGSTVGILARVHGILAGLVTAGTINEHQADAVQAQADAGSIDPKQLVQQGILMEAQMREIANQIDELKRNHR